MALTNIMGSQATRDADTILFTRAGLEIGVAATKTFTAQVPRCTSSACWLARVRDTLPRERLAALIAELKGIPSKIDHTLESVEERVQAIAARRAPGALLPLPGPEHRPPGLSRGGAEDEGDLLHPERRLRGRRDEARPIALLDESTPVVCVATDSPVLDKVLSNVAEVSARGADVIAIATEGSERGRRHRPVVYVRPDWVLQPILAILPLQLLAYHVARLRA